MAANKTRLERSDNNLSLCIQMLFIGIVLGTVGLAFLLVGLHSLLPQSTNLSADLLIEAVRGEVNPEPTERFVFTNLAVVIPIIAFVSAIASAFPTPAEYLKKTTCRRRVAAIVPLMVAVLFFVPFLRSNFLSTILGKYSEVKHPDYPLVILLCAFSLLWCFRNVSTVKSRQFLTKDTSNVVVWLIFICSVLLQILSWRLLGINSVGSGPEWSIHADAVIYSLSQVLAGKTLLVDLPSQYGLWAEMVAPLFGLTGFSVLGLTSLFAILQLVSLVSLFFVLSKLVKIPSLRAMGGIALVMVTFGTYVLFADMRDPYFQYWPIRFFWPAVSVLVFFHFSSNKTIYRSAFMSLLGSLGILWNLDSGLFIVVAHGAYLVARLIVLVLHRYRPAQLNNDPWIIKQYVLAIAAHVGITALVIVAFFWVQTLRSGGSLNLYWLFEYQKIFFNIGFAMLPLPRQIHPWMSFLGVYLLGLLVTFHSWLDNPAHNRMDTVFYLSMLGLGLFFYYQGGSHVLNLGAVCWPAVMIAAIVADECLRAIRATILPKIVIYLPVVAVFLFLVCCLSFVSHGGLMFTSLEKAFSTRGAPVAPFVVNEVEFIKKHAAHKHECLILSKRQGIYYAESGLASPLKGPGLVETLIKADQDRLIALFLNGGIQCVFLGIGEHSNFGLKLDEMKVREKYSVIATNSENTMQYLEPKP